MCPRVCVCKGTVEMGKKAKKALILIALLVLLAALYAESFRFSIVWDKVIEADTSLAVVDLASDEAVTARALEIVSTVQDVARIRYASNEGGIETDFRLLGAGFLFFFTLGYKSLTLYYKYIKYVHGSLCTPMMALCKSLIVDCRQEVGDWK